VGSASVKVILPNFNIIFSYNYAIKRKDTSLSLLMTVFLLASGYEEMTEMGAGLS
jgi:hypothetical protein